MPRRGPEPSGTEAHGAARCGRNWASWHAGVQHTDVSPGYRSCIIAASLTRFNVLRMSTTTTLACVKNAPLVPYTSAKAYLPSGLTASCDAVQRHCIKLWTKKPSVSPC